MKTPGIFSLDVELLRDVHALADRLGVSYSALAGRLLSVVRQPNAEPALRPWAEGLKAEKSARAAARSAPREGAQRRKARAALPKLKGSERDLLLALTDQWETPEQLGARVAQSSGVLCRALLGLRAKGLVEDQIAPDVHRVNGRPVYSRWRRAGPAMPAASA